MSDGENEQELEKRFMRLNEDMLADMQRRLLVITGSAPADR